MRSPAARPTEIYDAGSSLGDGEAVYVSLASGASVGVAAGGRSPLQSGRLPSGVTHPPQRFAGGWLAGLSVGQVWCFDAGGGLLAAPFQPELAPQTRVRWTEPGVGQADGKPAAVISDGLSRLYLIGLNKQPTPHFTLLSEHRLETGRFVSRTAATGAFAAAATSEDELLVFSFASLEPAGVFPLAAPVVWGPYAIGERLVLATADDRLHAVDPQNLGGAIWSQPVNARGLTGGPRAAGDRMQLSLRRGTLEQRDPETGEVLATSDLGQAIATGPTVGGLMTAQDGALLMINSEQAL